MDYLKVVFERIGEVEHENVSKIIGYLLLKNRCELEMLRLAFAPDHVLENIINEAKQELELVKKWLPASSCAPSSSSAPYPPQNDVWTPQLPQYFDQMRPYNALQVCDSFRQGYCKDGGNCRLLHILQMDAGHYMVLNPANIVVPDYALSQLEIELVELLKCRRGIPVSVSSLPILYFDKYDRVLQVEGYHLANHRREKFLYRMTQLLSQMTNNIRLIDRPQGRQSIILVEDINRCMEFNVGKNEHELQVYLTFLPQCIFSDQDVYTYFNHFGPVQEVRIPNQVKRMFGFVVFTYPETAALVLTKSNPHYICGSEVQVKPYRIKPMLIERKTEDTTPHQIDQETHFPDAAGSKIPSTQSLYGDMEMLENKLIEEFGRSVDLNKKHIYENNLNFFSNNYGFQLTHFSKGVEVNHTKTYKNILHSGGEENTNLPESLFAYEDGHGL